MRRAIHDFFRSLNPFVTLAIMVLVAFVMSGLVASAAFWLMNGGLPDNLLSVVAITSVVTALPLLLYFISTVQHLEDSDNRMRHVRDELSERIDQLDAVARTLEVARTDLEVQVARQTRELDAARSAAEDAIRAKSAFFAALSHELRTPLNAIIGFSDLMSDPNFLSGQAGVGRAGCVEEYADIINRSGQRLLSLVSDLVDLSNVESGKANLRIERVDLVSVVERVEAAVTPEVEAREQTLICLIDPAAGALEADRRSLNRLLLNLLAYAVRHSPPETTILLSVTGSGDHVAFTVRDEGKGMVPAEIREATEPLTRSSGGEATYANGAGLGFYIAAALAESQGGSLSLTSEPGKGTEARVVMPHRIAAVTPSTRAREIHDAVA